MSETMSEREIREAIAVMNNSDEYLALKKYYSEDSIFKTLGISRDEEVHSSFIAWLLNYKSNHELGYYSLQKFLQMLSIVCISENNTKARLSSEWADKFLLEDYQLTDDSEVYTEFVVKDIPGFASDGRVDILLLLKFKGSDKTLPILIENKVLSTENTEKTDKSVKEDKKQTEKYFTWGEIEYSDRDKYYEPIYVFLAPDFYRDIHCRCDEFIKVSYQNLVDQVIEPCLATTTNQQAIVFIENYLRCLNNASINNANNRKESKIMAFTEKELEILRKFHEKNRDIFNAVLDMLATDEALSTEDREKMKGARKVSGTRDYTKYSVEGSEPLAKGRCVLAIVKAVIKKEGITTFDDLEKIFPKELQGAMHVVKRKTDITTKELEDKRYYIDDADDLGLDVDAAVSVDWSKDNLPNVLAVAAARGIVVNTIV